MVVGLHLLEHIILVTLPTVVPNASEITGSFDPWPESSGCFDSRTVLPLQRGSEIPGAPFVMLLDDGENPSTFFLAVPIVNRFVIGIDNNCGLHIATNGSVTLQR